MGYEAVLLLKLKGASVCPIRSARNLDRFFSPKGDKFI
jgi:hypothetical protein